MSLPGPDSGEIRYSEPLQAEVVLSHPQTGVALLRYDGGILRPGETLTFAYPADGLRFVIVNN